MNTEHAVNFFKDFSKDKVTDYMEYWDSITPQDNNERFKRYLFAYCSVHTTFQGNIKGYLAIKDFESWADNKELLKEKLKGSGCGLFNNRTEYIWEFKDKFWSNPKDFYLTSKKGHVKKRDQIVSQVKGIGMAKVSFALEMIHPNDARVLCGDIHQLRLYGLEDLKYKTASGLKTYKDMERHWMINCGKIGVPSYIARSIYWDDIQNQENTRYWSYVLE